MIDSLYIAWKYIAFSKVKTATLVACITLISFLPVVLELLLNESEKQLMSRAVSISISAKIATLKMCLDNLKNWPLIFIGNGVSVNNPFAINNIFYIKYRSRKILINWASWVPLVELVQWFEETKISKLIYTEEILLCTESKGGPLNIDRAK